MSLIKCPECDHNVSSKAPFCPNCGVIIEGNIKRCPVCGGYALMAAMQCPHCGTKFAPQSPRTSDEKGGGVVGSGAASDRGGVVGAVDGGRVATAAGSASATAAAGASVAASAAAGAAAVGTMSAAMSQPSSAVTSKAAAADGGGTEMVDPRARQPKRGGAPWYLLILAILFICIGGFFYWENENQEASEERAYELLRDCNNPLNFEDFIARYPTSRHIDEVRMRLDELRQEDAQWHAIAAQNDAGQLKDFIAKHPTSPYKKVALHKIDSLDWREAERTGTSAAYSAYIQLHDNGEYLDQAFQAQAAAKQREEMARRDSLAAAEARQRDSLATAASEADVVAPM